jgi:hypothetical protein
MDKRVIRGYEEWGAGGRSFVIFFSCSLVFCGGRAGVLWIFGKGACGLSSHCDFYHLLHPPLSPLNARCM